MNPTMDAKVLSFWSKVKRQEAYKATLGQSQEDPKVSQELAMDGTKGCSLAHTRSAFCPLSWPQAYEAVALE